MHPEHGPRILFFSGGTAIRELTRSLKQCTHNSVHLITPFDSGGSSAHLRRAFGMPSVGDLRNRLLALADESRPGSPPLLELLSRRLAAGTPPRRLRQDLDALCAGADPGLAALTPTDRESVQAHLGRFRAAMPSAFDLRGACVGNLVLTGAYLATDRDLEAAIGRLSRLVEARGVVTTTARGDLHLAADLEDGACVVGQHRLTGGDGRVPASRVAELYLVDHLQRPNRTSVEVPAAVGRLIEAADLICYPMGSFFTSVLANLLPSGVGKAISRATCPKLYLPSTGRDPEQVDMMVSEAVEMLIRMVRRDAGTDNAVDRILDLVILDRRDQAYARPPDVARIRSLGVEVLRAELASAGGTHLDPGPLSDLLMSVATERASSSSGGSARR